MNLKMLDGNDMPHESLLITRQKTKLRNAFNHNMSTDLKLSKAPISKLTQPGGFLRSLLTKLTDPLMRVAIPLGKNVVAPLRITAAASWLMLKFKRELWFCDKKILIISNKEMNDIKKIIQPLEDSNILLKGVTKTIKNETKELKGGFLRMLIL